MCALYIVCKVSGKEYEKNFTDIMFQSLCPQAVDVLGLKFSNQSTDHLISFMTGTVDSDDQNDDGYCENEGLVLDFQVQPIDTYARRVKSEFRVFIEP